VSDNQWFSDQPLPIALCAPGAVSLNGVIYLVGGQFGGGLPPSDVIYRSTGSLTNSSPSLPETPLFQSTIASIRPLGDTGIQILVSATDGKNLSATETEGPFLEWSSDLIEWQPFETHRPVISDGSLIFDVPFGNLSAQQFFRVIHK